MTVIEFGKPPRSAGRQPLYDYDTIAETLMAKPKEWAKAIIDAPATLPNSLRKGSIAALRPELGFQFAVRETRMVDGQQVCTIWMRYNPDRRESEAVINARREKRNEEQRKHRANRKAL